MAADRSLPRFQPQRPLGRTGFVATAVGIGDLADRSVPLARCVATLHRAMVMFRFPNEQDAALQAAASFQPLPAARMVDVRRRAVQAMEGKGAVWWNP
jgi:hypothetical protein